MIFKSADCEEADKTSFKIAKMFYEDCSPTFNPLWQNRSVHVLTLPEFDFTVDSPVL